MWLCINAAELRKALAEIEAAEQNGFMHCQAVFQLASAGPSLGDCTMTYDDMIERGHPSDPKLNWGRGQAVTKRHRLVDGVLIPIKSVA